MDYGIQISGILSLETWIFQSSSTDGSEIRLLGGSSQDL